MPSTGTIDGAPYHLTVYRSGQEVALDEGDHRELFSLVAGRFRCVKGLADRVVHAPGPLALVGGYPVRFGNGGVAVDLPTGLSLEAAIEINRRCQRYDGIEGVDASGPVHLAGRFRKRPGPARTQGNRPRASGRVDCPSSR
jgi:hypothetical protein